jgi:hypothetical protein
MTRKDARIYQGNIVIGTRSTTGYFRGQDTTPDAAVQLTVNSGLVLEGVDFTPGVRVNPVVTIAGAQKILGRVTLPSSDYGTPSYNIPYLQDIFDSIFIRNNTIDSTTLGRHTRGENAAQRAFPSSFIRFLVSVQDEVTYAVKWLNINYLNARQRETNPGGAGRVTGDVENPNPFTYASDLSPSSRDITGSLITALNIGSVGGLDTATFTISDNPTHVVGTVMDGVATTIQLPYLPVNSTDISGTGANIVTVNGVITAITSISSSTGLVTLTGAGSADDEIIIDYETDYVAP